MIPSTSSRAGAPRPLEDYVPNESLLLSVHQIARLHTAAGDHRIVDDWAELSTLRRLSANPHLEPLDLEVLIVSWLEAEGLLRFEGPINVLAEQDCRLVFALADALTHWSERTGTWTLWEMRPMLRGVPEERFRPVCDIVEAIGDPFERAFVTLVGLSCMPPFRDPHKRASRWMMNLPFVHGGLPPFSFFQFDKAGYVRGVWNVRNHGNTGFLAEAFTTAYERVTPIYRRLSTHVSAGNFVKDLARLKAHPDPGTRSLIEVNARLRKKP